MKDECAWLLLNSKCGSIWMSLGANGMLDRHSKCGREFEPWWCLYAACLELKSVESLEEL
jgi:hypothetical protein